MKITDESHTSVATQAGILGMNPTATSKSLEIAMYARNELGGNQSQKFNKDFTMQCDFRKLKGHTKENYWKLIGYSQDYKAKKKF